MSDAFEAQCDAALKLFSEELQCVICLKLPKDTSICPHCSVLYCHGCIRQWLTRAPDLDDPEAHVKCCPHCRKDLTVERLVKLKCFDRVEHLGPMLENISFEEAPPVENYNLAPDVVPKPKYTVGHFTLRNFKSNRGPGKLLSKEVVDSLGSAWKLEVWPKGNQTDNHWISAFLILHKGFEGRYEFVIELLNGSPMKRVFTHDFNVKSCWGSRQLVDTRLLPANNGNPFDLNFRFFVRPVSFEENSRLLDKLQEKLKAGDAQFQGKADQFHYCIYDVSNHSNCRYQMDFTDSMNNDWKLGVNKFDTRRALEFQVKLIDGFPGLYKIDLQLTNAEDECAKELSFQHMFEKNSKAIFNMQIRWKQVEEYGFTHFDEDFLEIWVTIRPVKINLRNLQRYLSDIDSTVGDTVHNSGDEQYYY